MFVQMDLNYHDNKKATRTGYYAVKTTTKEPEGNGGNAKVDIATDEEVAAAVKNIIKEVFDNE